MLTLFEKDRNAASVGFQRLKQAIDDGHLLLRFICGVHGSGSTASFMRLGYDGGFDVVVNEPDCLDFVLGDTRSIPAVFDYLASIYDRVHNQPSCNAPVRMLIKLMPSTWHSLDSYDQFLELDPHPLFIVRYPAFTLEKRLSQLSQLLLNRAAEDHSPIDLFPDNVFSSALKTRNYSEFPAEAWVSHEPHFSRHSISLLAKDLLSSLDKDGRLNMQKRMYFLYAEHVSLYHLMPRWEKSLGRDCDAILDFEAFQHKPGLISKSIFRDYWQMETRDLAHPPLLINAYDDFYSSQQARIFNHISFGQAFSSRGRIDPPTVRPMPLKAMPYFLKPALPTLVSEFMTACAKSRFGYPQLHQDDAVFNPVYLFNAAAYHQRQGNDIPPPVERVIRSHRWPFRDCAPHIRLCAQSMK